MRHMFLGHFERTIHLWCLGRGMQRNLRSPYSPEVKGQVKIGQILNFIIIDKWYMICGQICPRNTMQALFGVYGVNFCQKRGQSRSNPKTCMLHWSFGSSPTGSNKARDLKIGMLMHHITVYHIYSGFLKNFENEEKIQNFQKYSLFWKYFLTKPKFWKSEIAIL